MRRVTVDQKACMIVQLVWECNVFRTRVNFGWWFTYIFHDFLRILRRQDECVCVCYCVTAKSPVNYPWIKLPESVPAYFPFNRTASLGIFFSFSIINTFGWFKRRQRDGGESPAVLKRWFGSGSRRKWGGKSRAKFSRKCVTVPCVVAVTRSRKFERKLRVSQVNRLKIKFWESYCEEKIVVGGITFGNGSMDRSV